MKNFVKTQPDGRIMGYCGFEQDADGNFYFVDDSGQNIPVDIDETYHQIHKPPDVSSWVGRPTHYINGEFTIVPPPEPEASQ